jgi:hypothetical protein
MYLLQLRATALGDELRERLDIAVSLLQQHVEPRVLLLLDELAVLVLVVFHQRL